MTTYNYTDTFRATLELTYAEAEKYGIEHIGADLMLWGVILHGDNAGLKWLVDRGIDMPRLVAVLKLYLHHAKDVEGGISRSPRFSQEGHTIIATAARICASQGEDAISPLHLIYGLLLGDGQNILKQMIKSQDKLFDAESLELCPVDSIAPQNRASGDDEDDGEDLDEESEEMELDDEMEDDVADMLGSRSDSQRGQEKRLPRKNIFDKYGIDLTAQARVGHLDVVVGREQEIERMVQILSRRKKSNPVLIGEAGVGKTALVEGLAQRIVQGEVPHLLLGKRIVNLDVASLVAGTKYRGQFEERIKALVEELCSHRDVILFIDEIHTVVGAGGASGSLDVANILKPALARGEFQCIGATTLAEYRKYIEKDGALERRFQKLIVQPSSVAQTREILERAKGYYESYHRVSFSPESLDEIVVLSDRYLSDRYFPDKALDVMDEVGARAATRQREHTAILSSLQSELAQVVTAKKAAIREQKYELAASYRSRELELNRVIQDKIEDIARYLEEHRVLIDREAVATTVAMMSNIPVDSVEGQEVDKLRCMGADLSSSVMGQDKAIESVVRAIQRSRLGLREGNRPIGTFLFLGPTGVGKTYLAKTIARLLFGTEEALIRVDMSEYMEKFAVSRLVGAPPGYVGYDEGGQLTEQVRRRPYSVVLFDEIEKAHRDVYNLLLQIMDEGMLTDSEGRRVDFRNTIVIITSNVGSREACAFGRSIGFSDGVKDETLKGGIVRKALQRTFSPEFLGRLDEIVEFEPIGKDTLRLILDKELSALVERVGRVGYRLVIEDSAKDKLVDLGYSEQYGVRPLKRTIQRELEDRLTDLLLTGSVGAGDSIVCLVQEDKIYCTSIAPDSGDE